MAGDDRRRIVELLRDAQRRPGSYGLDARYAVMVAYVLGLFDATRPYLLEGFQEWVVSRLVPGTVSNTAWYVIIAAVAGGPSISLRSGESHWSRMSEEQSVPAVQLLVDLVDEFLALDAIEAATDPTA